MRRRTALVLVLGLLTVIRSAAPAAASWSGPTHGSATAKATTIAAPGTLTAGCGLLLNATVKLDWGASASSFVAQYEVQYGTSPSSPSTTVLVSALTYTTPALGIGTWYFTVRSAKGAWRSTSSNQVSKGIVSVLFVGIVCS
jgi:hypothetical protein